MPLFKPTKTVQKINSGAREVGGAIAEKFKERFSQRPKYAMKRTKMYERQAKEVGARAKVVEAKARIAQAESKIAKSSGAPQQAFGQGTGPNPYAHLFGSPNKSGNNYEHLFGKVPTMQKEKFNANQARKEFRERQKSKPVDPYAHLFGNKNI